MKTNPKSKPATDHPPIAASRKRVGKPHRIIVTLSPRRAFRAIDTKAGDLEVFVNQAQWNHLAKEGKGNPARCILNLLRKGLRRACRPAWSPQRVRVMKRVSQLFDPLTARRFAEIDAALDLASPGAAEYFLHGILSQVMAGDTYVVTDAWEFGKERESADARLAELARKWKIEDAAAAAGDESPAPLEAASHAATLAAVIEADRETNERARRGTATLQAHR